MTQFSQILPKDIDGQKTTAVPIAEKANVEWVTPVIDNDTILKLESLESKLTSLESKIDTIIDGTTPAAVKEVDTSIMKPIDKQAQAKQQIENNTTVLAASATYTGASFDTMSNGVNYTWLTGYCVADQAGNLYMQESVDGTTWVTTKSWALTATNGVTISEDIRLRYVRFLLTNGATAQGSLKLYSYVTFKG